MYEMYPQAWAQQDGLGREGAGERPRRRARKVHSVLPAVIARQLEAGGLRTLVA
jgi:hypothetical protein